jgi:hypothetical protein
VVEWGSSGKILKEGKLEGVMRGNGSFEKSSGKSDKTAFRRGGNRRAKCSQV